MTANNSTTAAIGGVFGFICYVMVIGGLGILAIIATAGIVGATGGLIMIPIGIWLFVRWAKSTSTSGQDDNKSRFAACPQSGGVSTRKHSTLSKQSHEVPRRQCVISAKEPIYRQDKNIVTKKFAKDSNLLGLAERNVTNVFAKQIVVAKRDIFASYKLSPTIEQHIRALLALEFVTVAAVVRYSPDWEADWKYAGEFSEMLSVLETVASRVDISLSEFATDEQELVALLEAASLAGHARIGDQVSGASALSYLKSVVRDWAFPLIDKMTNEASGECEPLIAFALGAGLFVHLLIFGEHDGPPPDGILKVMVRHVSTNKDFATVSGKCAANRLSQHDTTPRRGPSEDTHALEAVKAVAGETVSRAHVVFYSAPGMPIPDGIDRSPIDQEKYARAMEETRVNRARSRAAAD